MRRLSLWSWLIKLSWGYVGLSCHRVLVTIFILTDLTAVTAEAQHHFESWDTGSGLPQNSINSIIQTRDGYLWLATNDGLARFDGLKFTVFDSSNTSGFCCNRVTSLYEDVDGSLWIGIDGNHIMQYHNRKFESFETFKNRGPTYTYRIQSDGQGNLVMSTYAGLLVGKPGTFKLVNTRASIFYRSNSGSIWYELKKQLYQVSDGREESIELPPVTGDGNTFYEDHEGSLWMGHSKGLIRLKDKHLTSFAKAEGLFGGVNAITEDLDQNLWVGTTQGLYRIRNGQLTRYTTADGLSSNVILSVFVDREGTLWVGTADMGLNKVIPQVITSIGPQYNVYPVFEDRSGTIWIGTWPTGISTYRDGHLERVDDGGRRFAVLPLCFAEDNEGRVWIGSDSAVWWYQDREFHDFTDKLPAEARGAHAILQDHSGVLWFGSDRGLVRVDDQKTVLYTTRNGLSGDVVKALLEDQQGNLWIGTNTGLSRMSGESFTSYTRKDGLGSDYVRDLKEGDDGTIWVGTFDGGLSRVKDGRVTATYDVKAGLFAKGVFRILDDNRGNFWMSSNIGIYRVSKQQLDDFAAGRLDSITSVSYGREDGMLNVECNGGSQPAGVMSRDEKLLFPTQSGVAVINLREVKLHQQAPEVVVEKIELNGHEMDVNGQIQLPYNARNLEIQYVGLSFIKPETVRYRYKLDGYDSEWVEAGNRRIASYSSIPPGKYNFILAAANSDGVWSAAEPRFVVVVTGPFWNSWWFVVPSALAIIGICYTIYRIYILKFERDLAKQQAISRQLIESQEIERSRIARELHDDFVQRLVSLGISTFNLREKIPEVDEKLRGQVMDIYDRTMSVTDDIRKLSRSLHPAVLQYVGLIPAIRAVCDEFRSQHDIAVDLVVDEGLESGNVDIDLCVYRIVQQGLSNVVQHASASGILVSLLRSGTNMELIISDDGKGFDREKAKAKGGVGLVSLEERVASLGGKLAVESRDGSGTEITAVIPIKIER